MPIANPPPPDLQWSFELPDRLKIAIADAIVLHSRLESLCIECIWEIEKTDLERKKEIAKNWGSENFKLLKKAVAQLPGAETDRIWPTMKALGKERNLIGHGVWMWTSEQRPLVVWHAKFLEDPDWVGAEWFDWTRFEHFDKRVTVLVNTFAQFKLLLVKAVDAQPPAPVSDRT
ncbi:MAG TPA: hypothetical protein VFC45_07170 [Pseudolabrys sp.]|nr:hypothetical protein [Pseudolabrys sp.]